jgi:cyclophilin family peptidyl-prolyl cis-trans isomerase
MGKLFLIIIIIVGVFFGIVSFVNRPTVTNQYNSTQPTDTPTLSLQQPTSPPTIVQRQQSQSTQNSFTIPQNLWVTNATSAAIKTVKGEIDIQLYTQDAPKTVTNFATLAKVGYYNNLTFHRVEDWVIQGGDPNGNGSGGNSIYGPTFEDELNPNTQSYKDGYKIGVVAMANRGSNTNGSQFFILKTDYPLDHNYTIFGKVVNGIDVVKNIQPGDKIIGIVIE